MKTKEEIEEFCDDCKSNGIGWFRIYIEDFINGKPFTYIATTPQGHDYGGFRRGTMRMVEWSPENGFNMVFYNLSPHRARQYLAARGAGKLEDVDPIIINNYITNGHSTRRGLFAHYSQAQLERMDRLAMSHIDYLGNETGNSKQDHWNRVAMRNL